MYERVQVRRMLGISERQLRSWERQGLAPALKTYGIADLVILQTLIRLRQAGVPIARVRQALQALRERIGGLADPLREYRLISQGRRVIVQAGGQRMEPVTGQLLLDFGPDDLRHLIAFPSRRDSSARASARSRRAESNAWFEKAVKMEQAGAPMRDIIEAYQKAIEADPSSAAPLVNLGTVYYHMHQLEEAEKLYRQAVEAEPGYALAHYNLANLYDEKGDRGQALFHYLSTVRLDPAFADAHYNLALLYQSAGQIMRAMRHWKVYLKLDPHSQWAAAARHELDKLKRATVISGARSPASNATA